MESQVEVLTKIRIDLEKENLSLSAQLRRLKLYNLGLRRSRAMWRSRIAPINAKHEAENRQMLLDEQLLHQANAHQDVDRENEFLKKQIESLQKELSFEKLQTNFYKQKIFNLKNSFTSTGIALPGLERHL